MRAVSVESYSCSISRALFVRYQLSRSTSPRTVKLMAEGRVRAGGKSRKLFTCSILNTSTRVQSILDSPFCLVGMIWVFQLPWLRPECDIRANTHDPLAKESTSDTIPWIDSPQDYGLEETGSLLQQVVECLPRLCLLQERWQVARKEETVQWKPSALIVLVIINLNGNINVRPMVTTTTPSRP